MHGFYQFKDNKYFNQPSGNRLGLSIFPYTGYNSNLPYAMAIPIVRSRMSKNRLEDDNPDYRNNVFDNETHYTSGPLPYIYKVNISGVTGKYSCNTTTCDYLNNRDFYLYQTAADGSVTDLRWIGVFCDDAHPNGIYIRKDNEGISDGHVNQPKDNVYDLLELYLIKSSDKGVDNSYFILTLKSSMSDDVEYPLLFNKTFASGERIFALEETIELTGVQSVTIDNGIFSNEEYTVNNSYSNCNYLTATATLTPYQYPEKYDIRNNHNAYGDITNFGIAHNKSTMLPVVTSSGTFYIDEYFGSTTPRLIEAPGAFSLEISRVTTRQQEKFVPCDIFFNREFKLKWYAENSETLDRNNSTRFYYYDNGIEDAGQRITSYIGMTPYSVSGVGIAYPPNFLNLSLDIAGTGGYIQLNFHENQGYESFLSFRHAYDVNVPLRETVFDSWTLHNDTDYLNRYCNFDNVLMTLTPISGAMQLGQKPLSCSPLCEDNTTPTSMNIEIRVSGHVICSFSNSFNGGQGLTQYDHTFNISQDLISNFFTNIGEQIPNIPSLEFYDDRYFTPYTLRTDYSDLTYYCSDNGEDSMGLHVVGDVFFPTQSVFVPSGDVPGFFGGYWPNLTFWFNGIRITANQSHDFPLSGCPTRYDCTKGLFINGNMRSSVSTSFTLLGVSGEFSLPLAGGGSTAYSYSLACSGTGFLDGFL